MQNKEIHSRPMSDREASVINMNLLCNRLSRLEPPLNQKHQRFLSHKLWPMILKCVSGTIDLFETSLETKMTTSDDS